MKSLPVALLLVAQLSLAGEPVSVLADPSTLSAAEPVTVAPAEASAKVVSVTRKKSPAPALERFPMDTDEHRPSQGVERLVYGRAPVRVALSADRERRIYLPWESALHLPPEAGGLRAQVIGTTLYLTGQSGQPPVRIIAEGLEGQGMIPLDIVVRDAVGVPDEMEIFMKPRRTSPQVRGVDPDCSSDCDSDPDPDLVQLTRYCSQQMYAPQRLVKPLPGVRAIDVRNKPVVGLYRTSAVLTTPIGAWRSATQYVTAVRFTNRGHSPIELDMDLLRGHWVAATPQHHVLSPAGSEADTTAVCLISDRPFDAARP